MTKQEAIQKLLDCARAEIGYHESGENLTKYAAQYDYDTRLYGFDMSGQPWCDYFVDWCFMKTFGFNAGSLMTYQFSGCSGASCQASAGYYRANFAMINVPEPGDQIFFYVSGGINHTGLVESVNENIGTVTTIEGNSSDSVRRNTYPLHDPKIAGYGRPDWQIAETIPESDDSGTGNESRDEGTAVPCSDTVIGMGNGSGTKTDKGESAYVGEVGQTDKGENAYVGEAGQTDKGENAFVCELTPDAEFGPLTKEAVFLFQKTHGMETDGEAGPETWDGIALILGRRILKTGATGRAVTALQCALNAVSALEQTSSDKTT